VVNDAVFCFATGSRWWGFACALRATILVLPVAFYLAKTGPNVFLYQRPELGWTAFHHQLALRQSRLGQYGGGQIAWVRLGYWGLIVHAAMFDGRRVRV